MKVCVFDLRLERRDRGEEACSSVVLCVGGFRAK